MVEAASRKWVCQSWRCGAVYEGTDRTCPTCRNTAMPQSRVRIAGVVLIVCGLFLVGMMAALSSYMVPLMLAQGAQVDGSSFSGTPRDAQVIMALFAVIALFGLGSLATGFFQLRYGRKNWPLVIGLLVIAAVIFAIAWAVKGGYLLSNAGSIG